MAEKTTDKPKRTRTPTPTIRITPELEAKLGKLADVTATKARAAGIMLPAPTSAQLVEVMVDTALESENGAAG